MFHFSDIYSLSFCKSHKIALKQSKKLQLLTSILTDIVPNYAHKNKFQFYSDFFILIIMIWIRKPEAIHYSHHIITVNFNYKKSEFHLSRPFEIVFKEVFKWISIDLWKIYLVLLIKIFFFHFTTFVNPFWMLKTKNEFY